jgi:hypothetical protein
VDPFEELLVIDAGRLGELSPSGGIPAGVEEVAAAG